MERKGLFMSSPDTTCCHLFFFYIIASKYLYKKLLHAEMMLPACFQSKNHLHSPPLLSPSPYHSASHLLSPPPFMGEVGCEASHQIFVGEGATEKLRGVVARNSHQPYQKNSVLSFSAPPPPAVRAASGLHFAGEGWVGAG